MRVYDNKHWISILLSIHKSDSLKTLKSGMIAMAVYAAIVAFLEIEYFKIDLVQQSPAAARLGKRACLCGVQPAIERMGK